MAARRSNYRLSKETTKQVQDLSFAYKVCRHITASHINNVLRNLEKELRGSHLGLSGGTAPEVAPPFINDPWARTPPPMTLPPVSPPSGDSAAGPVNHLEDARTLAEHSTKVIDLAQRDSAVMFNLFDDDESPDLPHSFPCLGCVDLPLDGIDWFQLNRSFAQLSDIEELDSIPGFVPTIDPLPEAGG